MKPQVEQKVLRHQVGVHAGTKHQDVPKEVKLQEEVQPLTEVRKPRVLHPVRECGKLHQVMQLRDLLHREMSLQDIQHQVYGMMFIAKLCLIVFIASYCCKILSPDGKT